MGFMLGSIVFMSKPPLKASRVYVKCPCPCHIVKNPSWDLFVKEEIYFYYILGLLGLLHQVRLKLENLA